MTERSEYALETLREGREFTLYRGRQNGNPSPVLLLALAAERPSPHSLRRLEQVVDDEEPLVKLASETFEEPRVPQSTEGRS
jgi:hypothetical protein